MHWLAHLVMSLLAALMSIALYVRAGESISVFILTLLGVVRPDLGVVVAPCVILYYCTRHLLP